MAKIAALSVSLICAVAASYSVQSHMIEDQNAVLLDQNRLMQERVTILKRKNEILQIQIRKLEDEHQMIATKPKADRLDDDSLFHSSCTIELTDSTRATRQS